MTNYYVPVALSNLDCFSILQRKQASTMLRVPQWSHWSAALVTWAKTTIDWSLLLSAFASLKHTMRPCKFPCLPLKWNATNEEQRYFAFAYWAFTYHIDFCHSFRAKDGHPTMFLKIVHYALFGSSPSVRDYMFSNGVDKDTVHLNDLKFFKSVTYILVSFITRK